MKGHVPSTKKNIRYFNIKKSVDKSGKKENKFNRKPRRPETKPPLPLVNIKDTVTFVLKNLPLSYRLHHIRDMLKNIVNPERIYLAKDKKGKYQGMAIIRTSDVNSIENVKQKLDKKMFDGKKLVVVCSNFEKNMNDKKTNENELVNKKSNTGILPTLNISLDPPIQLTQEHLKTIITALGKDCSFLPKSTGDRENKLFKTICFTIPFSKLQLAKKLVQELNTNTISKKVLQSVLKNNDQIQNSQETNFVIRCNLNNLKSTEVTSVSNYFTISIRNIPFKVDEEELFKLVKGFGLVTKLHFAKHATDSKSSNKHKGFAFVEFKFKKDAVNAIKALNGEKLHDRVLLVNWKSNSSPIEHVNVKNNETEIEYKDPDINMENANDKDNFDENLNKEISHTMKRLKSVLDLNEKKKKSLGVQENSDKITSKKIKEKNTKPNYNDATEGKTIHLRNIPLVATLDDIKDAFKSFGDIVYVRLVKNKSDFPTGTGFLKFKSVDSVEKVMNNMTSLNSQAHFNRNNILCNIMNTTNLPLDSRGIMIKGQSVFISPAFANPNVKESTNSKDNNITKKNEISDKNTSFPRQDSINPSYSIDDQVKFVQQSTQSSCNTVNENMSDTSPKSFAYKKYNDGCAQKEIHTSLVKVPNSSSPSTIVIRNLRQKISKIDIQNIIKKYIKSSDSNSIKNERQKSVSVDLCMHPSKSNGSKKKSKGYGFIEIHNTHLCAKVYDFLKKNGSNVFQSPKLLVEMSQKINKKKPMLKSFIFPSKKK